MRTPARNDVGKRLTCCAEAAFALQHPRDAAIQAIEDASKDNGRHRLVPLPRNGESYAGQSEAKRHCRHGIWRNLSQTDAAPRAARETVFRRSEEHTSELQYLMRTSYAVFCLKNKTSRHN